MLPTIAFGGTGWYSDYVIINPNNAGSNYYWIGSDPSYGTQFGGHTFTDALTLIITGTDMKYWSDTQDRNGGAFYWMIKSSDGSEVINGPNEVIWNQSYLGGNDYQGTLSDQSINVLDGLSASTTYQFHLWAKSWDAGGGQGDSWLNNGGSNYVATINTSSTLPVELSTFTAQYINNTPTIYWTTQSETDNLGWFVYRNMEQDFTSATQVSGMIEGHGTTTQQQSYLYEDLISNPQVGDVYYYWLESVDYSGTIHHFNRVAIITIPDINDPQSNVSPPVMYDLTASPNPFAEATKITFTLDRSAMVDVSIYDVKGALVKTFDTQHVTADDEVKLNWNGKNNSGKDLPNAIYLYSLQVNGQDYATKQMILMK